MPACRWKKGSDSVCLDYDTVYRACCSVSTECAAQTTSKTTCKSPAAWCEAGGEAVTYAYFFEGCCDGDGTSCEPRIDGAGGTPTAEVFVFQFTCDAASLLRSLRTVAVAALALCVASALHITTHA